MKIHHIGYLVKDLPGAAEEFRRLGYDGGAVTRDGSRGVDICFLEKDGCRVELVSPYREDSVVSGLMKRYKNSPYHICYASADMEGDVAQLEASGYVKMGMPEEAPAIGGRKTVFLMNEKLGMIEVADGR